MQRNRIQEIYRKKFISRSPEKETYVKGPIQRELFKKKSRLKNQDKEIYKIYLKKFKKKSRSRDLKKVFEEIKMKSRKIVT